MRATFYASRKRINSFENPELNYTKRTVFDDVYFKDSDISMTDPILYIAASNFPETAYCVLDNFGATDRPSKLYYFVREIIHDCNNRWYIQLHLDSLLTYKNWILSQTAFIERSASHYDQTLIDTLLPTQTKADIQFYYGKESGQTSAPLILATSTQTGTFVLGVLGQGTGLGVKYYQIGYQNLNNLFAELYNPGALPSFFQDIADLQNCLISLTYLPVDTSWTTVNNGAERIYIGSYSTNVLANPIRDYVTRKTFYITIPQRWTDYRQIQNTEVVLYLPMYGMIKLSSADLFSQGLESGGNIQLTINYAIDAVTGAITIQVLKYEEVITTITGQGGIQLPMTVYKSGDLAAVKAALASVGSLAIAAAAVTITGGVGAMAIGATGGALTGAATSVMNHIEKTATTVGSQGGMSARGARGYIECYVKHFNTSTDPALIASLQGRPCYAIHQLSALTGYCKTRNFSLQNSDFMTMDEQREVENMFNTTGVYI